MDLSGGERTAPLENWAGNITYSTRNLHLPASAAEVGGIVRGCAELRPLGTRHSFNTLADSRGSQIALGCLDEIDVDDTARTVSVGAGVTYGQLAPVIDARGYALRNLASLPHISVAGAVSTATHGSGIGNGCLATEVTALELVTAGGDTIHLSAGRDPEIFPGAVVGLGALGVITRITLELVPAYEVAQSVYRDLSLDHLRDHLDEIFGAGYSVSLFTDWQNHRATQVWIKRRTAGDGLAWPKEFFGARPAGEELHPIEGQSAESTTGQLAISGPWYQRLPHFRLNFTPSRGRELQTEYFVAREHGYEAILAVEELRDRITPLVFVTELRTVAADELWMSMAYRRPSLAIHFTWRPDWPEVQRLLPRIEDALAPFAPRPHWGKLFTLPPQRLRAGYERLPEFKALAARYDPAGRLRNDFLKASLYSL